MMARERLRVDSHTLWDQIHALARHLGPTYEALGARALAAPVINVDEIPLAATRLLESVGGHGLGCARADRLLLSHPAG